MPNNFTYITGVPATANNPSNDQPDMLTNATSINSWTSVDHVGYNTNGSGIHKQVTLSNESAPGLGDGTAALYANNPVSQSWPLWQNGNPIQYQIIGGNANADAATASFAGLGAFGSIAPIGLMSAGWTYLPGGMMLQYGQVSFAPANFPTNSTVTFPVAFTTFTPSVSITLLSNILGTTSEKTVSVLLPSLTNFQCNMSDATASYSGFHWIAIGK